MNTTNDTADLIVIGGGFGGLIAATRAAELGLGVILLEKGEGDRYPCNSRFSGGIVHICFLDVRRDWNELYAAIRTATSGEVNDAQAKALARNASRLVDWLQDHGTRFMRFNMLEANRWCMAPPRALVPGLDWLDRGPDIALRELMARFLAAGGKTHLRTRALRLRIRDGACNGVIAERDGREVSYGARSVLVADGGFQANRAAVTQHIGPNFDAIFQRGAATGMGDGMRMAAEAGARLTNLRPFYGHLLAREASTSDNLWPYPELDAFTTTGVIVGPDGRRIADESQGGIAMANALARRPAPDEAIAIFDADIWEGPGRTHRIPANPLLEEAGATIRRAGSIAELAAQLDLPPDALADTVAQHNTAISSGNFSNLAPPRAGPVKAQPIRTAPFMAIRVRPGITYTMGGIEIDGNARVIGKNGTPIPGLLAAGATTGGLEGGGRNAYVGGIVKAGVFGLLAAEEAARRAGHTAHAETRPAPATHRFPMLDLIVRHGANAALILSPLMVLLVSWLTWGALDWLSIPAGLIAGLATYILVRSYTEIVTLITETLLPR
ncbi:MAG: FAD-dependent oxidoreductase [Hyphomicrobiaceae bacterium]